MKPALLPAALSAVMLGMSSNTFAQPTQPFCSAETLMGTYIFLNQGFEGEQPLNTSGMMSFNGEGQVALTATRSIDPTQGSATGTYSVNPDCTGSITVEAGFAASFYLHPEGDMLYFVRTDEGTSASGEAKRVTRKLILGG